MQDHATFPGHKLDQSSRIHLNSTASPDYSMGPLNEPDRVDSLSVPTGEAKTWEMPESVEKLIPSLRLLGTARCVD